VIAHLLNRQLVLQQIDVLIEDLDAGLAPEHKAADGERERHALWTNASSASSGVVRNPRCQSKLQGR
jgi:hypothetical protein